VRHPQGDLLIDTDLGRSIAEQMGEFPLLFRLGTDLVQLQAAADQLDAAGYDQRQLRYILLTHAYLDHVSGVPDFPGMSVLVTTAEHRFIDEGGWATAHAGDGSIVIVPALGHTPGSVVVFVTLSSGVRYAFVLATRRPC
jgi:glyoxylase-like metal-dependent hydrolase (beta-lactamase superfamily II)